MTNRMDRVIVALDVETGEQALDIVNRCEGRISFFKIGKQLFTAEGPDMVRRIKATGSRVFLDLKYHDIPNTVAHAAIEAARLGADIVDIHTSGGAEMMRRTASDMRAVCETEGIPIPELFGITILTSLDDSALTEIGYAGGTRQMVERLARLGQACGITGVVCSPLEITLVKESCGAAFKTLTPGIRPRFAMGKDDQKRVMTPKDAFDAGTDYIVIGRPITKAPDIREAIHQLADEIG